MIVRCIKNPRPDKPELKSLLMSHDHLVLAKSSYKDKSDIQIISPRDNEPVVYDMEFFEVVDKSLPPFWSMKKYDEECYVWEPETFEKENFWDDYYSGYAWAREAFEEVVRSLYKFHGLRYPKNASASLKRP